MNRLIIIGNGFDLSLGLETSYNHFLVNYLKTKVNELYLKLDSWDYSSGTKFEYTDKLIRIHTPPENIFRCNEEIKTKESYSEIIDIIKKNSGTIDFNFSLLEKIHLKSMSNNWIDFEVMYYDTLMELYSDITIVSNVYREKKIKEFQDNFEIFKDKFIDYLSDIKFDYDDPKVKDFYSKTSKRFTKDLNVHNPIKKIMLLSFNYTQSVNEFKNYIHGVECEVNYIHGNLEDKESVIFGFGDELDEDYTTIERERTQELFKNIKSVHYFKYPNYNMLYSFIGFSDEYEVYIYGHSCGISDRTLLNEIFENENCNTIRIFYHKSSETKDNFQDISVGLIRQFKNKSRMRQIVLSKLSQDFIYQLKRK